MINPKMLKPGDKVWIVGWNDRQATVQEVCDYGVMVYFPVEPFLVAWSNIALTKADVLGGYIKETEEKLAELYSNLAAEKKCDNAEAGKEANP